MTRRVWVAQCLCPDRHCILAAANEAETEVEAQAIKKELRQQVVAAVQSGAFHGSCAICGADRATWKYEVGRTPWETMAEAHPHLIRIQNENLATNALFGDLHKSRPN
jgi:hypothetical protein